MRLVHCADLHLGFRQFNRTDARGRNVRELDVMLAFRHFVDRAIALAPDLIVIAGDLFHSARPGNPVVIEAFVEFRRLMDALPKTVCVAVAGNHDFGRSEESGCLLPLFREVGITIVDRDAQALDFPELDLHVLAVPDTPYVVRPSFAPDPNRRFNVVVMHGEVEGMSGLRQERAIQSHKMADVSPASWDYIALGHYHVYQQLAPNMYYSGSVDYTSTNPWGEIDDEKKFGVSGKGFIERNLVTGEHTFHQLPKSRDHIDLAIDATGMPAEELNKALDELLDDAWPDMAIARVVVTGCTQDLPRQVNSKMLRRFRARALNLTPIYKRAEIRKYGDASQIPSRRHIASIEDMLMASLKRRQADGQFPADMSLEACYALGVKYLAQADEMLKEKRGIEPDLIADANDSVAA